MVETRIKIPKVNEDEIVSISEGTLGFQKKVEGRFEKIDNILFGIIASVVVSCVAVVVAVIGLFLDQMRYNNVAYKEYSQKIESVEVIQKTNEALLKQIQDLSEQSKQDRELIKQFLKK